MTSHSDVQVQANVYLNLLNTREHVACVRHILDYYIEISFGPGLILNFRNIILIAACHVGHFCKTVGDWSRVYPTYHEYASGAISSFFIGTLQGYAPALHYIENQSAIPLKMLNITNKPTC